MKYNIKNLHLLGVLLLLSTCNTALAQKKKMLLTPYELGNKNQTTTPQACIQFYKDLNATFKNTTFQTIGKTDGDHAIHLFCINPLVYKKGPIVFINNGIHPGEPEGIDAAMLLARDILTQPIYKSIRDSLTILIVPIYNVDGALVRSAFTRINQNGPELMGFRANAKNLDLNRDFMKMDSKNAQTLCKTIIEFDPHVFIDTHTSDGADYQPTLTYIETQYQKLGYSQGAFMHNVFTPAILSKAEKLGFKAIPYVETKVEIPDSGLVGFIESARFATGFTSLFQIIGYTVETHMLKPFNERVLATKAFIEATLFQTLHFKNELIKQKHLARNQIKTATSIPINFKINNTISDSISYPGYEVEYYTSPVTGLEQYRYNTTKPININIPYYNNAIPQHNINKPSAYIIPKAWQGAIERLKLLGIPYTKFMEDTFINVEIYAITDYTAPKKPYEGHFLYTNTKYNTEKQNIFFEKGDYMFKCGFPTDRFLVEALEPLNADSWFNWNFFDGILMQKEYFSGYLFEPIAAQMLKSNPTLKANFENWKKLNPEVEQNAWQQLYYIYKNSSYFEKSYLRYPVYRLIP